MNHTYLADVKSGFVDATTRFQLAAYASCTTFDNLLLPKLDGGLILRVDDKRCEPVWISPTEMEEAKGLFFCALRLWKFMVANNIIKNRDTYKIQIDGKEVLFPRVTAILKVLTKEMLVNWQIKQAVACALDRLTKVSPETLQEEWTEGMWDPKDKATAFMKFRGQQGRDLHKAVQAYLTHTPVEIPPQDEWLTHAYGHFKKWADWHEFKAVEGFVECKVMNVEHSYAGTLDQVVTVEN